MIKRTNIVVDGNGIFMRYFFALDEYSNSDGVQLHGFLGFCKCILSTIKSYRPKSLLITFDKCYNNFRREIDSNYKSNRKKLSTTAIEQINLSIDFLKAISIPYEFHSDYEADDLIASYVTQNSTEDFLIMSTDKDLCQILSSKTLLFNPFKRSLMNDKDVFTKYGVPVEDFGLFLALQGDGSDFIKGIKGVGPKTAVRILTGLHKLKNVRGLLHANNEEQILALFPEYNFTQLSPNMRVIKILELEMTRQFPKYNFSELASQIKLVQLVNNIHLTNHTPQPLELNHSEAHQFLKDLNLDSEKLNEILAYL